MAESMRKVQCYGFQRWASPATAHLLQKLFTRLGGLLLSFPCWCLVLARILQNVDWWGKDPKRAVVKAVCIRFDNPAHPCSNPTLLH